jgi:hypothetical protein
MAWIALPHAVVVCNSMKFRLSFSQMRLAALAHQALKLSLATRCAAHKIVSCLIGTARLNSASPLTSAPQNVTLDFVREEELLLHLHHVVVRRALL